MADEIKILVVDDELGIREGCRRVLETEDYRVDMAVDIQSGLQKIRESHGSVKADLEEVVNRQQAVERELFELEKENWELAVFPMEGHGFVEASSWADEYRRIFELFEETLRKDD